MKKLKRWFNILSLSGKVIDKVFASSKEEARKKYNKKATGYFSV